jgi:hypothetical protein
MRRQSCRRHALHASWRLVLAYHTHIFGLGTLISSSGSVLRVVCYCASGEGEVKDNKWRRLVQRFPPCDAETEEAHVQWRQELRIVVNNIRDVLRVLAGKSRSLCILARILTRTLNGSAEGLLPRGAERSRYV